MKTKAIILMTCVLLLSACGRVKNNNSKTPDIVPETASYYEGHNLVLADEYMNRKEYLYSYVSPECYNDEYIAVYVSAEKDLPDSNEEYINFYDYNGELKQQTDLLSFETGRVYSDCCIGNSKLGMNALLVDKENSIAAIYSVDNETLSWNKQFDIPLKNFKFGFEADELFETEDGYILIYDWLDGSLVKTDIARIDNTGKVIWDVLPNSNGAPGSANIWNDSLVYVSSTDQIYKVDLKTGKEQPIKPDDVLKTYQYGVRVCPDGKIIKNDGHEIKQYMLEDNTETVLLDFNYSDSNMFYLSNGNLQYADNKRAVFKDLSSSRNEVPGRCKLTILEKVEKNPYIGKKVLEIAPVWGLSFLMGEAQQEFNRNSKDYFAYISTRYDYTYFSLPDYYQEDVTLTDTVNLITDQLAVDIRNGNGPDIIIGLGDSTQLDSKDFLVNLYPYINGKNGIDKADYFENAFEAFAANDQLYQIPLTMNVLGIMTDKANVTEGKKGFTFDEYCKFVKEKCNGLDPISYGNDRQNYFYFLFCSMHEQFVSEKKMNIDNAEFRSLIEFSKNNISKDYYSETVEPISTQWVVLGNVYYDLVEQPCFDPSNDLFGAPSFDGRGPMITNFNTIAVTTCSSDLNVSWEFVKIALGYEAQKALESENPINRAAFNDYAKTALKEANITLKEKYINRVLDDSDIERYVHMLEKAECVAAYDTQVYKVIIEELQPYYADKKSIDETIKIISDRCQKVLDER
jgi:ABC-type glycerol-3-phosphate transport system substrate-binding protein